ncbi:orotate phosphoribosyltransferase [Bryobacterales bacterium F-183]|nr:orotate phosphoribosyltransferase [Bryobacterales bacterium F-183]
MQLLPTQDEVLALLRESGALRNGHFEYPNGLHTDEYLQVALAMSNYQTAKILSVGLSRKLRENTEIRAILSDLSVVCPATGGLPVAYGIGEALRARKVYWAEREIEGGPLQFRQFHEVVKGEKVVLVDDILRTGTKLTQLKALVEECGAEVLGLAVMVHQPYPGCAEFDPLYKLATLNTTYWNADECPLCKKGEPLTKVLV